jgi:hypothetical protein
MNKRETVSNLPRGVTQHDVTQLRSQVDDLEKTVLTLSPMIAKQLQSIPKPADPTEAIAAAIAPAIRLLESLSMEVSSFSNRLGAIETAFPKKPDKSYRTLAAQGSSTEISKKLDVVLKQTEKRPLIERFVKRK